jgi:hypothetical protein
LHFHDQCISKTQVTTITITKLLKTITSAVIGIMSCLSSLFFNPHILFLTLLSLFSHALLHMYRLFSRKHVHVDAAELAGRDALLKEDIKLCERPSRWLRNAEVRVDDA